MKGRIYWGTTGTGWCLPASSFDYPSYLCTLSSKTDLLVQEPCKSVVGVILFAVSSEELSVQDTNIAALLSC